MMYFNDLGESHQKSKKKKVYMHLNVEEYEALQQEAQRQQCTKSELMCSFVKKFLEEVRHTND